MPRWRQAIELALTDVEIETLRAISRSRTELASRVARAAMCLPIPKSHRFLRWNKDLASIIRRSSVALSGRWPMGHWRRSTTDHDEARSR